MPMSERENYLRAASMTGPEWIPCRVYISGASWREHRREMEEVVLRHPTILTGYRPGKSNFDQPPSDPTARVGQRYTDPFGCVWTTEIDGLVGQVVGHPLSDWSALETYRAPDPACFSQQRPIDWSAEARRIAEARREGRLASGSLDHGFLLMRLWYLREFENLMLDIATDEPRLHRLIRMVNDHNRYFVERYLRMGVDEVSFGEDLGTQSASIISPHHFKRWIAPAYKELMQPCRSAGCQVYLHSDGYIMELVDILIECGVTILNPQDLVNGIDALAGEVKGRVCIDLDIDRQKIVPFGTPAEIRDLIEEEVRKLGSPEGGLMLKAGIYPPTPPENVEALCRAMEEFRTWWWR